MVSINEAVVVPQKELDRFKNLRFWNNITKALGFELKEKQVITGASGLEHRLLSIGVDDKNKRLLLLSADSDPRVAVMMQNDIKAEFTDLEILVARPVICDLAVIAERLFSSLGLSSIGVDMSSDRPFKERILYLEGLKEFGKLQDEAAKHQWISDKLRMIFAPLGKGYKHAILPALSQLTALMHQAAYFDWSRGSEMLAQRFDEKNGILNFNSFPEFDSTKIDRDNGVCPIPLYEFTDDDWELISSGAKEEEIKNRLYALKIYQYFFPPPDQLAIGLIDKGIHNEKKLAKSIALAPKLGHPLGTSELIERSFKMDEIPILIDQLSTRGYVANVEGGYEITPQGTSARGSFKIRPQEGAISRIFNRLRITFTTNINVK